MTMKKMWAKEKKTGVDSSDEDILLDFRGYTAGMCTVSTNG